LLLELWVNVNVVFVVSLDHASEHDDLEFYLIGVVPKHAEDLTKAVDVES